jgi:hypothetical protein
MGKLSPDSIPLAFIVAMESGHVPVVQYFASLAFDVNSIALSGSVCPRVDGHYYQKWMSPVLTAALIGDPLFFGLIASHRCFKADHEDVERALFALVEKNNLPGFQRLVAAGVSFHARNEFNDTVLCFACLHHRERFVKDITASQAFDKAADNALLAFAYCIQSDFGAGITALAPFIDDINGPLPYVPFRHLSKLQDDPGFNIDFYTRQILSTIPQDCHPGSAAIWNDGSSAILALLGLADFNVNWKTKGGKPLLFFTLRKPEVLKAICAHANLDINARDGDGNTVLHEIVSHLETSDGRDYPEARRQALSIVLQNAADRTLENSEGLTPWALFVRKYHLRALISEPDDIDEWIDAICEDLVIRLRLGVRV